MTKIFDKKYKKLLEDFETDFYRNPDLDQTPYVTFPEMKEGDTVKLDTDTVDDKGVRTNTSKEYRITKVSDKALDLEECYPICDYKFDKGSAEPKDLNAELKAEKLKLKMEDLKYVKKMYENTWMIGLYGTSSFTPSVEGKDKIEKIKQAKELK